VSFLWSSSTGSRSPCLRAFAASFGPWYVLSVQCFRPQGYVRRTRPLMSRYPAHARHVKISRWWASLSDCVTSRKTAENWVFRRLRLLRSIGALVGCWSIPAPAGSLRHHSLECGSAVPGGRGLLIPQHTHAVRGVSAVKDQVRRGQALPTMPAPRTARRVRHLERQRPATRRFIISTYGN
jgi:hypothetical protein